MGFLDRVVTGEELPGAAAEIATRLAELDAVAPCRDQAPRAGAALKAMRAAIESEIATDDVTMISVSRAPLKRLLAYRERMGWRFSWVSSYERDFNYDFERSRTRDQVSARGDEAPPVVSRFASECGTDPVGYLAEGLDLSVFAPSDKDVYWTYATTARGLGPVMVYYGIFDRVPRGRDEGAPSDPSWIRRHDGVRGRLRR